MKGSPKLKSTQITSIILECTHTLRFDRNYIPGPGDLVYCYRCEEYRAAPLLKEWQVRCDECRWSRKFGADIDAALLAQAKHSHHITQLNQVTRVT